MGTEEVVVDDEVGLTETIIDSVWIGVEMGTEGVVVDDEVGLTETIIDSVWIGVEIESIKRKLYLPLPSLIKRLGNGRTVCHVLLLAE